MTSFDTALKLASPRLSPPPTPLRSILIHGAVLTLWILAFAGSFIFHGIFAWSTGLVYVGYDTALLLFVAWQTLGLRGGARPTAASGNVPTLGVIIATYNEATVLPGTLSALFAQTDPPERIVIADDGSNDLTAVLLQDRYGLALPPLGGISPASPLHPSLYWLRLAHGGKAQALNAATSLIGTDTMITVDADTVLAAGATAAMRQAFATEPALVAATGVIIPICPKTLSGRVFQWFQTYEYIRNFLSRYAWMRIHSLLLISGAFAGFRRGAVIAVGGLTAIVWLKTMN